ncbi:MAG: YcjX family protein [Pseudorhodoplanes sp.]|jgi:predicted YcjX-like family ATPase|nr:YcjX family protein [Pseudorhodoplanes sp.]
MANALTRVAEQTRAASLALYEFGTSLFNPTVRLGVTGLSRAGKTVFITALIHALLRGGRFPVFEASNGRIIRARLSPQPDDAVPRFDYEKHVHALVTERAWPESTRQISEIRLVIEYQSKKGALRELTLDIVDYPGEWLLDLPLIEKSYETWSAETLTLAHMPPRKALAAPWLSHPGLAPSAPEDEDHARAAARLFTDYLRACRDERFAMSLLPPGRFLMPGDLADSPALTFAPLNVMPDSEAAPGSLHAMMKRRYEAYKDVVVRPFFRDHFVRLDRQIVLIDVLAALNAGPDALADLERALTAILECFNFGRNSWLSTMFAPRIDRVQFAATKADHLHHSSHDRLERILSRMTDRAVARAKFSGAQIDVVALAAVRATREAQVKRGANLLASIVGTPVAGEIAGGKTFDGATETVIYPGELPATPDGFFEGKGNSFRGLASTGQDDADFRFLRFRPPLLETAENGAPALPHIRLDRTLQFLIGDKLQ